MPSVTEPAAASAVPDAGDWLAARWGIRRRRPAIETLAEEIIRGRNAAKATAPTIDTRARTHECNMPEGRANIAMHRFNTVTL